MIVLGGHGHYFGWITLKYNHSLYHIHHWSLAVGCQSQPRLLIGQFLKYRVLIGSWKISVLVSCHLPGPTCHMNRETFLPVMIK